MDKQFTIGDITWTRINRDKNGNPRYVCHYADLNTDKDREDYPLSVAPTFKVTEALENLYKAAVRRAKELGGKKYHTKNYAGGIVFQSYNIYETTNQIKKLVGVRKATEVRLVCTNGFNN